LKLLALERFLRRCPEWVGKIVLIQIGISAHERGDDYLRTRNEVTELVNRINETWPGTVQFQECSESSMKLQQRLALMRASDVAIVTPIRDGLNLTPLVRGSLVTHALSLAVFLFGCVALGLSLTFPIRLLGIYRCTPRCSYPTWQIGWTSSWSLYPFRVCQLYPRHERSSSRQPVEDFGNRECHVSSPHHD
jgi:hypothetical protein